MRFCTGHHQHYCGIDLHARTLYLCIQDQEDNVVLHKNLPCDRARFLEAIKPFRAHKTASLLRGGLLPQAYAYPATMRPTRDLLRGRPGSL